jgi:hypothetical protein
MATVFKSRRRIFAFIAAIALATLLVLILLSTLRPARVFDAGTSPAFRIQSNLNAITKACFVYASDNNDHFPPHLVILVLDGSVSPNYLSTRDVAPLSLPSPPPPPSAWPTLAAVLDQHSAFIYTGADLTATMDAAVIIAYSKKSPLIPNCRLLAFADAHTEFVPDADLPKAFAASNAARATLHLPPVTLDGPPPAPPK